MFYWLLLRFFDLNAIAFHSVAWLIHAANTALVYLIMKHLTHSRSGAAIGAMLFASQAAFADIYWSFGTIFELVSACAFFAGILLWTQENRSWIQVLFCSLVFLFAVKAKEMAITLPAIWLACDLLVRRQVTLKMTAHVLLPVSVGIWYGLVKLGEMRETHRADLYYMDVRWITLGRGYGGYFNSVFNTQLRWQFWAIGFVALLLFFVLRRNRTAILFQIYVFVTFLPVIFLINHRELYLSYIPFLGLCGLAALLIKAMADMIEPTVGTCAATVAGCVIFSFLCWGTYAVQRIGSEERRIWQEPMSREYRAFVLGLRALPTPAPNETVFFDSHPRYFSADLLRNATQVAFRRTDIDAQLVSEFPADARYRLRFQDGKLIHIR